MRVREEAQEVPLAPGAQHHHAALLVEIDGGTYWLQIERAPPHTYYM